MSSEDPTRNIGQKYDTKSTLKTILERINALDQNMTARFDQVDARFQALEIRLDWLASEVKEMRSDLYELRAGFTPRTAAGCS